MAKTEFGDKVNQALSYMRLHGDTDEARSAAAQNNEIIDRAQWLTAGRRFRQEQPADRRKEMITFYSQDGKIQTHSNIEYLIDSLGEIPSDLLAIKFSDPVSGEEWITEESELRSMLRQDAPLSFTAAGLAVLDIDIAE